MTYTWTDIALNQLDKVEKGWLEFGRAADQAIKKEGATLRGMSIAKFGSPEEEDRLGRYHKAALFIDSIPARHPLYEHCLAHCSYNHYAELYKLQEAMWAKKEGELFEDTFEQFFIRNDADNVIRCRSVKWLRGKLAAYKGMETPPEKIYQNLLVLGKRAYNDWISEVERKGRMATLFDRKILLLLRLLVKNFGEYEATHAGEKVNTS